MNLNSTSRQSVEQLADGQVKNLTIGVFTRHGQKEVVFDLDGRVIETVQIQ
jgi:hypothetical protein